MRKISNIILWSGAALWLGLAMVGCVTTPSLETKPKAAGPLKLNPPKMRSDQDVHKIREHWVSIPLPTGQIFAQAKDGMDDVVAMTAQESAVMASVKTLEDVDQLLAASGKFLKKRRTEVLGEQCIRYERVTPSVGGENPSLRASLAAQSRTMPGPFLTRTLGGVFLHPRKPGCYITLTCSRTSCHGQIGDYYEELFDDFLGAFVVDNCLKAEPY